MLATAIEELYKSFDISIQPIKAQHLANALERRFGQVVKILGHGEMGFAARLKSGDVLKLTTDLTEVETVQGMLSKRVHGLPQYKAMVKVDEPTNGLYIKSNSEGGHIPLVAILQTSAGDITLKAWFKAHGWSQEDIDQINIILHAHIHDQFQMMWLLMRKHASRMAELSKLDLAVLAKTLFQVWQGYRKLEQQGVREFDLHCGNIMLDFGKSNTDPVVNFIDPGGSTRGYRQRKPIPALSFEHKILLELLPTLSEAIANP